MKTETDKSWIVMPIISITIIALVVAPFWYTFGDGKGGVKVPIWSARIHKRNFEGHEYILRSGGGITHSASCTNHAKISTGLQ